MARTKEKARKLPAKSEASAPPKRTHRFKSGTRAKIEMRRLHRNYARPLVSGAEMRRVVKEALSDAGYYSIRLSGNAVNLLRSAHEDIMKGVLFGAARNLAFLSKRKTLYARDATLSFNDYRERFPNASTVPSEASWVDENKPKADAHAAAKTVPKSSASGKKNRAPRRMQKNVSLKSGYSEASASKIILFGGITKSSRLAKLAVRECMRRMMFALVQTAAHITIHCRRKKLKAEDVAYALENHFGHKMYGDDDAFAITGGAQALRQQRPKKNRSQSGDTNDK